MTLLGYNDRSVTRGHHFYSVSKVWKVLWAHNFNQRKNFWPVPQFCLWSKHLALLVQAPSCHCKHIRIVNLFRCWALNTLTNGRTGSFSIFHISNTNLFFSLPNIEQLNGSEVTASEREKAERHLLRYFSDKKNKPDIYSKLVNRHGMWKHSTRNVEVLFSRAVTTENVITVYSCCVTRYHQQTKIVHADYYNCC